MSQSSLEAVALMALQKQLLGTWRSDKKRTLDDFSPYLKQKDLGKKRKISRIFGKLEMKWTRLYVATDFEGDRSRYRYRVVDESQETLIIRMDDSEEWSLGEDTIFMLIQFHETARNSYCSIFNSSWNYTEWFKRIE